VTRLWQRLWWRIWLAVLAAIMLVTVLSFVILRLLIDPERLGPPADALAQEIAAVLPAADAPQAQLQAELDRLGRGREAALAVFDAERRRLAQSGRWLPPPRRRFADSHWLTRGSHEEPGERHPAEEGSVERPPQIFAQRLDDGRWLVVGRDLRLRRLPYGGALWFALLALGTGLGAYPVVRRLTRRIERLQQGVEELGRGDLRARVPVQGHDEVARLAASFNTAAARIEQLLQSHRALLANASHELRSPMARVRLALDLLDADGSAEQRQALKDEVRRDIAELDGLIDEILLASRLDAQVAGGVPESKSELVELTALVAEECARVAARLSGESVLVEGDARLLRRLVRNLLENAQRYGGGQPIDVEVRARGERAELTVADRGPGVADDERDRIFEPFYRARGVGESSGGVGLGLALVLRIAQRHGGDAACLPRDGGGSVFRVTLAAARAGG
jgi:signal transduction histidine kinase